MAENKNQGSTSGRPNSKYTTEDKYNVESSSANDLDGCAATEMTGLMYKPPVSNAQLESYKNVYPFSPDEYVED